MKLIVGLGNPGRAYMNSRHNIGFQCLSLFASKHHIALGRRQSRAITGMGEVAGQRVILAKPRTFMNLSGEAVAPLVRYYRIDLPDLLVIYDDLDFPLGTIRVRQGGGPGGHNGMKSIIAHLNSESFSRIRVGIAPLPAPHDVGPLPSTRTPEFVLGHFNAEERELAAATRPRVADAILCILAEGIAAAMNRYNSL